MKEKVYIGIDIGKNGGFFFQRNSKFIYQCKMPLTGNTINVDKIYSLLYQYKDENCHIILENIAGLFGTSKVAAMSLGEQVGSIQTICAILQMPFTSVSPRKWQNEMFKDAKLQYKYSTVVSNDGSKIKKQVLDTKKTALLVAKRIFPKLSFIATSRSKKPHDGIVDACLLAEYGRRRGL